MLQKFFAVRRVNVQAFDNFRVDFPDAFLNIFRRNERKRCRMLAFPINKEDCVKDLYSLVCVHGWADLGNDIEIAVNEFT
jgi:hypothetical protein